MKNKLRLNLERKPNPYPDSPNACTELWGDVVIKILLVDGQEITLFNLEWDITEFIEWFTENQSALCQEKLSFQGYVPMPTESLAEAGNRLYSMEVSDAELAYQRDEAMYWYGRRHSISTAFFGVKLPDIVIGCNHGSGEISLSDAKDSWAYRFDMNDFCADSRQKFCELLNNWVATAQSTCERERATELLNSLAVSMPGCCQ